MKKRGKILRVPPKGPGLLMIEGRQYQFLLNDVWISETTPKPGLTVDALLDDAEVILTVTPVKSELAENPAKKSVKAPRALGLRVLRKMAAKCGAGHWLRN